MVNFFKLLSLFAVLLQVPSYATEPCDEIGNKSENGLTEAKKSEAPPLVATAQQDDAPVRLASVAAADIKSISRQAEGSLVRAVDGSDAQLLIDLFSTYKSLQASFVQQTRDETGELLDESAGKLTWQRPFSFRWDVTSPFNQSIVLHEQKHYQYDEDLEQLIVRDISEEAAALPKVILSNDVRLLTETYRVSRVNKVSVGGASNNSGMFRLTPVEEQTEISEILLIFANRELLEINLVDAIGQTSRFELSAHQTENITAKDFEIVTTDSTEIIYQ